MMKLFVAVLAALAVTDVSAVLTKTAAVGYKSSKIEIEDGQTGSFTVDVSAYHEYCNALTNYNIGGDLECFLEIDYTKYSAGEQTVSSMTSNSFDDAASLTPLGKTVGDTTTRFCQILGQNNGAWPSTVTISSVGTCGGIAAGCISSTDAALAGVRVIQGRNSRNGYSDCPTTDVAYVPFNIDTEGSNTAKFNQIATSAAFAYPTMKVEVPPAGDKLFLMLDITNALSTKYGVQFHLTANQTCGLWDGSTASACEDPSLVPETADDYKVYPATDAMVNGQRGSYSSSFINLDYGTWYVTPYVLMTSDDPTIGSNTIDFRYCAALGKECDSAFAAAPSMLFGAILAAVVAAIQRF